MAIEIGGGSFGNLAPVLSENDRYQALLERMSDAAAQANAQQTSHQQSMDALRGQDDQHRMALAREDAIRNQALNTAASQHQDALNHQNAQLQQQAQLRADALAARSQDQQDRLSARGEQNQQNRDAMKARADEMAQNRKDSLAQQDKNAQLTRQLHEEGLRATVRKEAVLKGLDPDDAEAQVFKAAPNDANKAPPIDTDTDAQWADKQVEEFQGAQGPSATPIVANDDTSGTGIDWTPSVKPTFDTPPGVSAIGEQPVNDDTVVSNNYLGTAMLPQYQFVPQDGGPDVLSDNPPQAPQPAAAPEIAPHATKAKPSDVMAQRQADKAAAKQAVQDRLKQDTERKEAAAAAKHVEDLAKVQKHNDDLAERKQAVTMTATEAEQMAQAAAAAGKDPHAVLDAYKARAMGRLSPMDLKNPEIQAELKGIADEGDARLKNAQDKGLLNAPAPPYPIDEWRKRNPSSTHSLQMAAAVEAKRPQFGERKAAPPPPVAPTQQPVIPTAAPTTTPPTAGATNTPTGPAKTIVKNGKTFDLKPDGSGYIERM